MDIVHHGDWTPQGYLYWREHRRPDASHVPEPQMRVNEGGALPSATAVPRRETGVIFHCLSIGGLVQIVHLDRIDKAVGSGWYVLISMFVH